jgi:ribonucleoside-diphosphate reductase alpha chain
MDVTGADNLAESPYHGATAGEIDWIKRVTLQAVVQKYVTHSISSTINLPSDVSEDKVGEIYLEAWRQGLKGITVYRDGSRSGVLVADDGGKKEPEQKPSFAESRAPKRPKRLDAEVVRFMNNDQKWIAVVGLLDGRPYEIFTGRAEDVFDLPNYLTQGWVVKVKQKNEKSRYDFQFVDKDGYRITIEGLSRSFDKEYWNYAKLISGVLRHGMPLPNVVDLVGGLNLYSDHINTWKNGVVRTLKRFIPDGTVAADHACSKCGDPQGLVFEEGCITCKSCGHSKCD